MKNELISELIFVTCKKFKPIIPTKNLNTQFLNELGSFIMLLLNENSNISFVKIFYKSLPLLWETL